MTVTIGRRELLAALGGAVVAWPVAALAQGPGRLWKIGVLANEPWPPLEGLRDGLRDLGYVEGKTHVFVYRFAQGNAERFPALASELVSLPVDVIVSWGTPASLAAHNCSIAVGEARLGATALGLQLVLVEASDSVALDDAFLLMSRIRPDAVLVVADPFLAGERVRIAEQMIKDRLPSMYSYHEHVVAGGLMTYTTNYYDVFRREGLFIDKIFKGAKPGDLPVQQPTKFDLVINLKTAKALGLEIPDKLLALADEVIE